MWCGGEKPRCTGSARLSRPHDRGRAQGLKVQKVRNSFDHESAIRLKKKPTMLFAIRVGWHITYTRASVRLIFATICEEAFSCSRRLAYPIKLHKTNYSLSGARKMQYVWYTIEKNVQYYLMSNWIFTALRTMQFFLNSNM